MISQIARLHPILFCLQLLPHVEQELLVFPEFVVGVRATRSFVYCVLFCRLLPVLLFLFFWPKLGEAITNLALWVFLPFTNSDYLCGIFKRSLNFYSIRWKFKQKYRNNTFSKQFILFALLYIYLLIITCGSNIVNHLKSAKIIFQWIHTLSAANDVPSKMW